jgi:hypothetical protein
LTVPGLCPSSTANDAGCAAGAIRIESADGRIQALHPDLRQLVCGCNTNAGSESPQGATGDGMAYIITATNLVGAISLRRDAPVAARKKALELIEQGMMNVRITDEHGRQYEPAEFDQLHLAEE